MLKNVEDQDQGDRKEEENVDKKVKVAG